MNRINNYKYKRHLINPGPGKHVHRRHSGECQNPVRNERYKYERMLRQSITILLLLTGISCMASTPAAADDFSGKWPLCPPDTFNIPARPPVPESLQPGETYLSADRAQFIEGGISHMIGNAEAARDAQQLRADRIDYHQQEDTAYLKGNVSLWDKDIYMSSADGYLDLDAETGLFNDVDFLIPGNRGRGSARQAFVRSGEYTRGTRVDYTTCDPLTGSRWNLTENIWKITARELKLDHEKDVGTARHVILKVRDIPVFYTPYLNFPLSDERKSGFLAPSYGSSSRNGIEIQTPYYWNIAPHMDATLTPRIITDSGVMLMGEYRYLFRRGEGHLNVEYLPDDSQSGGRDRSFVNFDHTQSFLRRGRLLLEYNRVSDLDYLEDFGGTQLVTSTQFLRRRALGSYQWNISGHSLWLQTLIQDFQTVDRNIPARSRPYKRLPSTTFHYNSPAGNNRLNYALDGRVDFFTRGEDTAIDNVNGLRYDLFPSISLPYSTAAYYLTPKVGLRFTQYHLNDNILFEDDSPNRTLPFFSLDSGVFLERNTSLFGTEVLQTLEPRLYYLYIAREDQSDLPVFDTGLFDTSLSSIFFENRFSGPDRVEDANRITLAVTSRLYSESTGAQLGFISIGQVFHLRNRTVVLGNLPVQTDTLSSVVAAAGTTLFRDLELRAEIQWNPNSSKTEKMVLAAQYSPGEGKVFNAAYRARRPVPGVNIVQDIIDIEQTDVSFRWPIRKDWSIVGRWNFAVPEGRSLDLFGGVEYNSCCWGFRVVARRFLSSLDGDFQTGIFMQFELKGLAGIGQTTVDFLTQTIPGYRGEF